MRKKIISLEIQDMGGIKAFHVEPNGEHVIIGGPNGAGKTSAVWDLVGLFGGGRNRKDQKVRIGAEKGTVVADLGDIVVKWASKEGGKDTLAVTTRDGAKYPSTQKVLEKMWGARTFDALAFFRGDAATRVKAVAKLAKVDITAIEARIKKLFTERTVVKRLAKTLADRASADFDFPEDTPDEPIDVAALAEKLREADAKVGGNANMRRHLVDVQQEVEAAKGQETAEQERAVTLAKNADIEEKESIEQATAALQRATEQADHDRAAAEAAHKQALERAQQDMDVARAKSEERRAEAEKTSLAVIVTATENREKLEKRLANGTKMVEELVDVDPEPIREQLANAHTTNHQVGERAKKQRAQADADAEEKKAKELTKSIEAERKGLADAIAAADIPIPGLGIADGDVTLDGKAAELLCSMEKIKVSLGIGIAADPEIGVLLMDKWSDLDKASRKVVIEMADAADMQIISTTAGLEDQDITVMIVDGENYEQPADDETQPSLLDDE